MTCNIIQLDGQTILHTACRENLEKLVKFLHTCGANPNLRDNDEQTPLLLAAERGHTSICEMLTEKFKANVNMRAKVCVPSMKFENRKNFDDVKPYAPDDMVFCLYLYV